MSMITATAWVPRGYPAQSPLRHQLDEEEYDRISKLAKLQLDDAKDDLQHADADESEDPDGGVAVSNTNGETPALTNDKDNLEDYKLDDYDDEPERDVDAEVQGGASIFGNIKGLAYHENNDDDPYITMNGDANADLSDEDEREELEILPTDNMILAARVEDEVAHLECYVYEDDADNMYVHHDVMLPATPLCIEWLDMPVGKPEAGPESRGNFMAVGTMDPDIELWDLDTVDSMYPNAIFGAGRDPSSSASGKKKKKKSRKPRDDYHVDAVLSLAANKQHRNLLASASADKTVKLWDLNTESCAKSYHYHSDKVCSLAWHPEESTAMLSGGYDQLVIAGDMRAPDSGTRRWHVDSDVEKVAWDPHDPNYFYVSTESGILHYFDARQASTATKTASPVWRLQAHDSSLTSFSLNSSVKGYFATGSDDKTVKLWNAQNSSNASKGPALITSREIDVGKVFSVNFAPDEVVAYRLAVAGSKGSLKVWDTSTNKAVRAALENQLLAGVNGASGNLKERIIGIEEGMDDEETDDSSEEEDEDGEANSDEPTGESNKENHEDEDSEVMSE
ncbi:MAG: hypothetical protein Q9162_000799 [Coniocarpon cinnabarinum]